MNRTKRTALGLAEVLVTCGLFTLFGMMTLQAMIVGMRSQSHVTASNTARRNIAAAFSLMRRDFNNAYKDYSTFSSGAPASAPTPFVQLTLPSRSNYADVSYDLISDGSTPPGYKLRRQTDPSSPPGTLVSGIEWMTYATDTDPSLVIFTVKMKDMRETMSFKARLVEVTWAY